MSELRRLRYFLAVADTLNFTRAAERLHVAQPALSRQIRLLERDLGVELLHRSTHSVELTAVGETIRARADAIVTDVDDLWAFARHHAAGTRRTIVIGHTPSIAYGTAPLLVDAVKGARPELDVQGSMRSLAAVVAGVRDGTLAGGLVRSAVEDGLEVHPVRRLRLGVLVAAHDRLADAPAVPVAALAERPIVLHARDENPGHYDDIVELCRRAGFEPTVVERPVSFDPSQAAVRDGRAVAIQADTTGTIGAADLRWIPFDPPQWQEVQLVVLPPPRPAAVDQLVAAVAAATEERAWLGH